MRPDPSVANQTSTTSSDRFSTPMPTVCPTCPAAVISSLIRGAVSRERQGVVVEHRELESGDVVVGDVDPLHVRGGRGARADPQPVRAVGERDTERPVARVRHGGTREPFGRAQLGCYLGDTPAPRGVHHVSREQGPGRERHVRQHELRRRNDQRADLVDETTADRRPEGERHVVPLFQAYGEAAVGPRCDRGRREIPLHVDLHTGKRRSGRVQNATGDQAADPQVVILAA